MTEKKDREQNTWTNTSHCPNCDLPLTKHGECAYCASEDIRKLGARLSKKPNAVQERTIVLFPNGEARREVLASHIEVPDLWHFAMKLKGDDQKAVLETWHLANELRRIVIELSTPRRPKLPKTFRDHFLNAWKGSKLTKYFPHTRQARIRYIFGWLQDCLGVTDAELRSIDAELTNE